MTADLNPKLYEHWHLWYPRLRDLLRLASVILSEYQADDDGLEHLAEKIAGTLGLERDELQQAIGTAKERREYKAAIESGQMGLFGGGPC